MSPRTGLPRGDHQRCACLRVNGEIEPIEALALGTAKHNSSQSIAYPPSIDRLVIVTSLGGHFCQCLKHQCFRGVALWILVN